MTQTHGIVFFNRRQAVENCASFSRLSLSDCLAQSPNFGAPFYITKPAMLEIYSIKAYDQNECYQTRRGVATFQPISLSANFSLHCALNPYNQHCIIQIIISRNALTSLRTPSLSSPCIRAFHHHR